jgi:hypothetical protein
VNIPAVNTLGAVDDLAQESAAGAVSKAAAALDEAATSARSITDPDERAGRQVEIADSWRHLASTLAVHGLGRRAR